MESNPLIQTKLNRPPLPVDLVPRPRLTTWLERQRRGRPLTLISAPAGYGKSTLMSCWLLSAACPTAWVSLDEQDSDIEGFLRYFLAAIQAIFPAALPESQAFLMVTPPPPIPVIASTLINEINQIETPFILALDDCHRLKGQIIQGLLGEILSHPPRNLHLVLGTRMDPLLPLTALRARSQMTEIRIPDLRFQPEETQLLFKNMLGHAVDPTVISEVEAQAEGWVIGLRLAALAMQRRIGTSILPGELSVHNRYVNEYLISEILAKQTRDLSDCMVKTSILKRFCAELCETVCFPIPAGNGSTQTNLNGRQFLEQLHVSNLFVIPLDDQHEWFRYHQLFQELLQKELSRRFNPDEIAKLHTAAGHWYAQNGLIEEAIFHLMSANDTAAAIQLIAQHRYRLMNTTQWARLDRWLSLFPSEVVERSAELGILKIWLVHYHSQITKLPALLEHLESILAAEPNQELVNRLAGEVSTLRSLIAFHRGDIAESTSQARLALEQLPTEFWIARVLARNYLGGSLLLGGDLGGAYHAHYGAFEEEPVQNKRFKAALLTAVSYIHWLTADLQGLEQVAKTCIALCQEMDYRQILGYGNYHLGCVRYQQNDLPGAEELFASVVTRPYHNYGDCYTNSACGLALTYQAQGREEKAREVAEEAIAFLLATGNTTQLPLAQALQAELALMQGRLLAASQWVETIDPVPPLLPMYGFLAPHLTLVKIWLAQNTPASQEKAAKLLKQLQTYLAGTQNTRFLTEALALQALLSQALGEQDAALAALGRALDLAEPGRLIRIFVDLGKPMAMLSAAMAGAEERPVTQKILAAFDQLNIPTAPPQLLIEPLTDREMEVLNLLVQRYTNQEIAGQLIITTHTVNYHLKNIYTKLDVHSRRQAAQRAQELRILPPW